MADGEQHLQVFYMQNLRKLIFFNSSSFINTSILFDAAFLEIMRRLFLFYKPSDSPFLRSGQERVLQSLLCSVGPWVRS